MPDIQSDTSPHVSACSDVGVFRKFVSYLVIIALTFSPLTVYPSTGAASQDQQYTAALARLDEFMRLVTQLRSHIDRTQFDTGALLEKLDFDAETIISYVTDDIDFEQYRGLLRGAQGTLMSEAGNSLDQAVLLGSLLNDAAYESRIVRGRLSKDQARKLILQTKIKEKSRLSGDLEKYKDILTRMSKLAGIPDEQISSFVSYSLKDINITDTNEYRDAVKNRKFILNKLASSDIKLKVIDVTEILVEEAQDYFWVEYRLGQSIKWEAVHPAFNIEKDELKNLTVTETFKNKIPEKLQHRFRFQVFLEQKTGDKLISQSLVGPWERPVVNLLGKSLSFSNVPDGFKSEDDIYKPESVASNTNFLIPQFKVDRSTAIQSDVFDMNGIIVDATVVGQSGSALFQTLGNKMESAIQGTVNEGVARKEKDEEFRTLSAQWMEITLISPGGKEKKFKRYIIDRIGAENRERGLAKIDKLINNKKAMWKLASTYNINLTAGLYPKAYIFDRYLEKIISARPLFVAALTQAIFPSRPMSIDTKELADVQSFPGLLLSDSFNQISRLEGAAVNYHHEPALIILKNEFDYDNDSLSGRIVTDIASNNLRVLKKDGSRILNSPIENVLFGTWITRLEERADSEPLSDELSNFNTRLAFNSAMKQDLAILLLKPNDVGNVSQISGISSESRQAILRDLSDGYHIIVPEKATGENGQTAWWRINIQSGETIGMINEGLGGEIFTYANLVHFVGLKVAILMALPDYLDCINSKKCSNAGCLKAAGVGVFMGYAIGFAVGLIATAFAAPGAVLLISVELSEAAAKGIGIGVAQGMLIAGKTKKLPELPKCFD